MKDLKTTVTREPEHNRRMPTGSENADALSFYEEVHRRYGDPTLFVERLNKKRETHGISRGALAKRAGLQATHVSRWLGGRVTPSMETMVVLDEALDRLIESIRPSRSK